MVVLSLVSSCFTTKSRLVVWLLTLPPWNPTDDNNDMSANRFTTCYRISSHKEHVSTTWLQGGCWHSLTITHHLDSTCRNGHVCDTHCKPSLVYLLQPMNFPSYVCGINALLTLFMCCIKCSQSCASSAWPPCTTAFDASILLHSVHNCDT